jgi:O-antigen/teichoic acid export membrane protein
LAVKKTIGEFAWVAGPKLLAGGVQFAFSLLLLRYMGPSQFGVMAICLAGVLLGDSILGGATDSGVLRLAPLEESRNPARSLQYQQAGLALKLAIAGAAAVPLLLLAQPITRRLFQEHAGVAPLLISIVALMGMLAVRSAQMHFQVRQRFALYGAADLLNTILKSGALVAVVLLWRQPTPELVVTVYAFAPLVITAVILTTSGRMLLAVNFSAAAFWELSGTVKWYLATAAMGTVIARMDIFLVSAIANVGEAGIFSAAQTIALVPHLLGTYIAVVFSPRIMPMWEAGTLKRLYERFQAGIAILALSVMVVAWFTFTPLAQIVFPASFLRSSGVALVLLPAGLAGLVNFPLTILLLLFLRPKFLLAFDCVLFPLLLLAYAWVIPQYGAMGAAFVTSAAALLKTAVMQCLAWTLLRKGPTEPAMPFRALAMAAQEAVDVER